MSECLCSSLMQQRALPLKDNRFRMIEWYRLKSSFWSHKESEKMISTNPGLDSRRNQDDLLVHVYPNPKQE